VHVLGTRGPDQIPHYLRGFDVATVPYRLAEYTHHVYPAKLNEYLAMGLAVVATPLSEIVRFNRDHGDVVAVAADAAAFEMAVVTALTDRDPVQAARRVEVARTNSWTVRLESMSALIAGALTRQTTYDPCAASQAS
jgi:glycosyltransferase involved in cell wall biosynthesis